MNDGISYDQIIAQLEKSFQKSQVALRATIDTFLLMGDGQAFNWFHLAAQASGQSELEESLIKQVLQLRQSELEIRAYQRAGQPYGATLDGLRQWLTELRSETK